MPFDISIAGTSIPTDPAAFKDFRQDLNLAFSLGSALASLLDAPLSAVPASAISSIAYTTPAASWNPAGGPVQFGLNASTTGSLQIVNAGGLLSYTDGLDVPAPVTIPVPAGFAYTLLTLTFTISANAMATYSGGAYGVKAGLDTSAMYSITFCKAFDPATPVRSAVAQAFESFVLPLHAQTLQQMSPGDYLLHEFDGNLHLSFGAYVGVDKLLYAGQAAVDVSQTFGTQLATFTAGAQPTISASASLDFTFQYATRFEALLVRSSTAAHLHVFRSQNWKNSLVPPRRPHDRLQPLRRFLRQHPGRAG